LLNPELFLSYLDWVEAQRFLGYNPDCLVAVLVVHYFAILGWAGLSSILGFAEEGSLPAVR